MAMPMMTRSEGLDEDGVGGGTKCAPVTEENPLSAYASCDV